MAANDVYTLAAALLAAVIDYFADQSPAIGLPERRYVTIGTPAIDCEQVTVAVPSLFTGLPGNAYVGPLVPGVTSAVEFGVSIMRCVPTGESGNPPRPADIETKTEELLTDAKILREAVFAAKRDGTFGSCNDVVIAECVAIGPEGGFGGWNQLVRVGL